MVAALVETAAACYLLFGKDQQRKLLILCWLSACFILYRVGLALFSPGAQCHCLGTMTEHLPADPATIDLLLKAIVGYLSAGSACFLLCGGASPFGRGRESKGDPCRGQSFPSGAPSGKPTS
jgi:hypothetical protein